MKLEKTINKYFTKESIITSITKYQLYYQIGLVSVALLVDKNIESTYKKLDKLNLQIDPQKVFESMYQIILHMSNEENFDTVYNKQLKLIASIQMLDDFMNKDKDLINNKSLTDMLYAKIKDDTLFTKQMQIQFDNDYDKVVSNWKRSITDNIAQGLKDEVLREIKK